MTAIPLRLLYDLKERLADALPCASDRILAERAALDWAEASGMLTGFAWTEYFKQAVELPRREPNWANGPLGHKEVVEMEIPAGPHVAPEVMAGSASAEPASDIGRGPEGAEGGTSPDDAPVPPVAGGGTSSDKPKPWTEEEDRRAVELKLAGYTDKSIADELGRPFEGLRFRFKTKLKARLQAGRDAISSERTEDAPSPCDPPAIAEEQDSEPAAPQVVAEPVSEETLAEPDGGGAPGVSSPSAVAAPAPAFDPTKPLWWRQIDAVLNAIGYKAPFSPQLDLELVERLAQGQKLAEIAADMGIDAGKLKARFIALTPDGRPTLSEQQRLIEVLRARAGEVAPKAAE